MSFLRTQESMTYMFWMPAVARLAGEAGMHDSKGNRNDKKRTA